MSRSKKRISCQISLGLKPYEGLMELVIKVVPSWDRQLMLVAPWSSARAIDLLVVSPRGMSFSQHGGWVLRLSVPRTSIHEAKVGPVRLLMT